jgi:tetratricopeptide (TPR) repeat protein
LERVRKDQMMVARLIEARLKASAINFHVAKSGNLADTAFREAFAEYGLDVENLTPGLAGEKIRQSAIREELVCALYDWAAATTIEVGKISQRGWRLLHLAEKNDPDPWRRQLVEPVEQKDWATVLRLAEQIDPAQLSPSAAWHVASCVRLAGKGEKAMALLQEVHRRHPDDFQLNVELARSYYYDAKPSRPDEAARYYTAASVLRPNNAQVYAELGNALRSQNKLPEAIAACHEAIRIDPDCSSAFFFLGLALLSQGKPGEAEVAFRKQLSLPFESDSTMGHYNLGTALENQGKLADAAAEYNESIRLNSKHALSHYHLGWVLRQQGKFADSLASYLRAEELGSRTRWNTTAAQTAQAVRDAKRLVELEGKLPGLRKGETKPADANEQMELGQLCRYQRRYAESVAFYHAGFRAKPALATDLAAAHRYYAACSAARAGTGQGEDAATLTETERAALRKDALDWLRALVVLAQKKAESDKPQDRAAVVQAMLHWRRDTDLAAVRDAIDQLPEAERDDWRKLWHDVEVLLQRAEVPK